MGTHLYLPTKNDKYSYTYWVFIIFKDQWTKLYSSLSRFVTLTIYRRKKFCQSGDLLIQSTFPLVVLLLSQGHQLGNRAQTAVSAVWATWVLRCALVLSTLWTCTISNPLLTSANTSLPTKWTSLPHTSKQLAVDTETSILNYFQLKE